jgi:hypothetical protein
LIKISYQSVEKQMSYAILNDRLETFRLEPVLYCTVTYCIVVNELKKQKFSLEFAYCGHIWIAGNSSHHKVTKLLFPKQTLALGIQISKINSKLKIRSTNSLIPKSDCVSKKSLRVIQPQTNKQTTLLSHVKPIWTDSKSDNTHDNEIKKEGKTTNKQINKRANKNMRKI